MSSFLIITNQAHAEDSSYKMLIVSIDECASVTIYGKGCMNWTEGNWIPRPQDFDATTGIPDHPTGWTIPGHVRIFLIHANYPWRMTVEGTSPYFTCDDGQFPGAWQDKPASNIVWRSWNSTMMIKGGGQFHELTCSPYVIGTGTPTKLSLVMIMFRILLDWHRDTPGLYTYENVVLTFGAQ